MKRIFKKKPNKQDHESQVKIELEVKVIPVEDIMRRDILETRILNHKF